MGSGRQHHTGRPRRGHRRRDRVGHDRPRRDPSSAGIRLESPRQRSGVDLAARWNRARHPPRASVGVGRRHASRTTARSDARPHRLQGAGLDAADGRAGERVTRRRRRRDGACRGSAQRSTRRGRARCVRRGAAVRFRAARSSERDRHAARRRHQSQGHRRHERSGDQVGDRRVARPDATERRQQGCALDAAVNPRTTAREVPSRQDRA